MKITLTAIKADIGSIGGNICPSRAIMKTVGEYFKKNSLALLLINHRISYAGNYIVILCTHRKGVGNEAVHRLVREALLAGTKMAKQQGLYDDGKDLLKDSFSCNIRGMGLAVAEMEFEERQGESFLLFVASETDPRAYIPALYFGFADPMHYPRLVLSESMPDGFSFKVIDIARTQADKKICLKLPRDIYNLVSLILGQGNYVIEGVYFNKTGEQVAAVSTVRLHNIASKYVGKDNPIMLVRVQGDFPTTGEILESFKIEPYVAGLMRGSYVGPLMPVTLNNAISFSDGPPVVSCTAYCMRKGKLVETEDVFAHPRWDHIRNEISALWR